MRALLLRVPLCLYQIPQECFAIRLLLCFQNKSRGAGCIPHSDVGLVARCYLSAARCDPVGTNRVIQHLKLRVFHSILKMMMEIHGVYRARDSWRSDLIRRRSDAGPTTSTAWLQPSNHPRHTPEERRVGKTGVN